MLGHFVRICWKYLGPWGRGFQYFRVNTNCVSRSSRSAFARLGPQVTPAIHVPAESNVYYDRNRSFFDNISSYSTPSTSVTETYGCDHRRRFGCQRRWIEDHEEFKVVSKILSDVLCNICNNHDNIGFNVLVRCWKYLFFYVPRLITLYLDNWKVAGQARFGVFHVFVTHF